ncbi:hypothetical protein F5Y17DRAFT_462022 [Xylariaceae sp. FL0594]|nr:hypothetical protein F5Y17DRAFT_462022 [Xylariaceae sp. FL0594]
MPSISQSRPPINASNTWIIHNARELIGYYDRFGIEDWLDEVEEGTGTFPSPPNSDMLCCSTMPGHPVGKSKNYDAANRVLSLDTIMNLELMATEIEAETERRFSALYDEDGGNNRVFSKRSLSTTPVSEPATPTGTEIEPGTEGVGKPSALHRFVLYRCASPNSEALEPLLPVSHFSTPSSSSCSEYRCDADSAQYETSEYEPPVYCFDDRDILRGEYFPRCPSPVPALRRSAGSDASITTSSSQASSLGRPGGEEHAPDSHLPAPCAPIPNLLIVQSSRDDGCDDKEDDDDESVPELWLPPSVVKPVPQRAIPLEGKILVLSHIEIEKMNLKAAASSRDRVICGKDEDKEEEEEEKKEKKN